MNWLDVGRALIVASMLYLLPSDGSGQASRDPPGSGLEANVPDLGMLRNSSEAEAEGARFARSLHTDLLREPLITRYPGRAERTCLRATDRQDMGLRTGDFAVSGMITRLEANRGQKVWWFPLHDPGPNRNGLLVRAVRIDTAAAPADTLRMVSVGYGYPLGTEKPEAFFPTGIKLPSAGEWLLVAVSGADWGCIIVNVDPEGTDWLRRFQHFQVRPDTLPAIE